MVRVWDASAGRCRATLDPGPGSPVVGVRALAVQGDYLISADADGALRVWTLGPNLADCALAALWRGHEGRVNALAVCCGRVVSGSADATLRVWDLSFRAIGGDGAARADTGGSVAVLRGHAGWVTALAAVKLPADAVLSASHDRTVAAWAGGTWAPLWRVEAAAAGSPHGFERLAACGAGRVLGGSCGTSSPQRQEVVLWRLSGSGRAGPPLQEECRLAQPSGRDVRVLLAVEGEVWAGVGAEVVVFGRGRAGARGGAPAALAWACRAGVATRSAGA